MEDLIRLITEGRLDGAVSGLNLLSSATEL
jgi:hypothetical protein